ncbi:CRISPR-associated endonuclease Cas2 [Aminobacterium colombiense]|uniref:CRISPR-associated endoribonuclease Cas2 n=1 Tax=Aminobacterium colombiense (strain DSM 12261 / ALA-1) TaxID=572547 RepID=D5ECI8_AMICL|nr:CRISPR-associated endonuclease Cas2 [Aminobacterium colombiense]ADE56270.1 CRISPR-associated protein Cas2 [Aminobacterium colombiense DSM 12261]
MKKWFIISYDIRNEKRLRKVAKLMEGYGQRIQYSVFRLHLNERGLEHLRWKLSKCTTAEDGLLITELCEKCISRLRMRNGENAWPDEPEKWIVL